MSILTNAGLTVLGGLAMTFSVDGGSFLSLFFWFVFCHLFGFCMTT